MLARPGFKCSEIYYLPVILARSHALLTECIISKLNLILLQSMACSFKRLNKDRYAAKTVVYYTHFTQVLFNSSVHKKKHPHEFGYDGAAALV